MGFVLESWSIAGLCGVGERGGRGRVGTKSGTVGPPALPAQYRTGEREGD